MVLTARYKVHAASQDAESRYHIAMVPVEGSKENDEAFQGTPGGLMRIGPLHADAGKHFTEGVEVLVDFEVLEPDIEEHEDPAPAEPLTPAELSAAYARGLAQVTMQAALDSAASNLSAPTPASPAPEPAPAPAVDPTLEPTATAAPEPAAPEQDAPNPGTAGVYPYMSTATYAPPHLPGTTYNGTDPAPSEPEEPGNPS